MMDHHQSEEEEYYYQIQKRLINKKTRHYCFVFSVSAMFSIFIWYYSSGFSIHYSHSQSHSFNAYFSTLFTHTLERKIYMFLICNGILAFIAKNSLIISTTSSSSPTTTATSDSDTFQLHASNMLETKEPVPESLEKVLPLVAEGQDDELQEENFEEVLEAEEPKEGTLWCTQNGDCLENEENVVALREIDNEGRITEESDDGVKVEKDDDEEVVAETRRTMNEESANTEELNRKFEEFIRKMKQEMRIDAQRQLIAV